MDEANRIMCAIFLSSSNHSVGKLGHTARSNPFMDLSLLGVIPGAMRDV